jgi:hypothetical protein
MPRSLPPKPSLEYVRKEAKDLLAAHQSGDPSVCDVLRFHHRFEGASDSDILAAKVSLQEMQHALARDYGFASWVQLTANVQTLRLETTEQRDAHRVVIQGVPHGNFDIHWDMPVRAMEPLLGFRGVDADRDDLLAVSGDAFALCHASHWQGTAYLCTPTNPVRNLAEGYGFRYSSTHAGPTGPLLHGRSYDERMELTREALHRIHAEIDAGRPVLISGAEAHCGSSSLVVGYEADRDWLCHVGDGRPYRWTPLRGVADGAVDGEFGLMDGRCRGTVAPGFVGGWQANPAYLIGERISDPGDRDRALKVLKLAVELHRAQKSHRRNWGGVDYYFGAEAYEQWAGGLERLDYPGDLEGPYETNGVEDAYDWYEMGNMDMQIDQIITGRSAAASFCHRSADHMGGSVGKALTKAAEAYDSEVDIARRSFAPFVPRFDGNDGPRQAWLSDARKRSAGAKAIRQMLEQEQSAVEALEQASADVPRG